MKKLVLALVLWGLGAQAAGKNYQCQGRTTTGQSVVLKYVESVDVSRATIANVTTSVAGGTPRTWTNLSVWLDSDGASDIGVTSSDWMLEFFMFSNKKVEARLSLFGGGKKNKKIVDRVRLNCEALR